MRRGCAGCGRRIVIRRHNKRKISAPAVDHDLCDRCWRNQRNSEWAKRQKEATNARTRSDDVPRS